MSCSNRLYSGHSNCTQHLYHVKKSAVKVLWIDDDDTPDIVSYSLPLIIFFFIHSAEVTGDAVSVNMQTDWLTISENLWRQPFVSEIKLTQFSPINYKFIALMDMYNVYMYKYISLVPQCLIAPVFIWDECLYFMIIIIIINRAVFLIFIHFAFIPFDV